MLVLHLARQDDGLLGRVPALSDPAEKLPARLVLFVARPPLSGEDLDF
jgi:hypothetical protein